MGDKADRVVDVRVVYSKTFLDYALELSNDLVGVFDVFFTPHEGKVSAPNTWSDIEVFLEVLDVLFAGTEEVSCRVYIIEG